MHQKAPTSFVEVVAEAADGGGWEIVWGNLVVLSVTAKSLRNGGTTSG